MRYGARVDPYDSPSFSGSQNVSPGTPVSCNNAHIGFTVNDNDDLANRARILLNRMCGVMPPRPLVHPILDAIFKAIQTSPVSVSYTLNGELVLRPGYVVMASSPEDFATRAGLLLPTGTDD